MNRRPYRTHALLAAAASAALAAPLARAATIDGTVTAGEYGAALVSQNTPTGFGNNLSELNQAFANYTPGGPLELALTGNMEGNGNGVVIFIDAKAGGTIANSVAGGGFGQFGSVGGSRVDDWGTDINGSAGVTATPGGGSIVSPNFNPDYAIEINSSGGGVNYSVNIIDLTVPNEPNDNRDVFLGTAAVNNGTGTTNSYLRDGGFTDAGAITHSFNNTNTAGVNAYNFTTPPGALGDPSTATTGFEFLFTADNPATPAIEGFLNVTPGHALRILPFVTNGGGDYLANQFLPGVNGDPNLEQAGAGVGGAPLFDARFYGDQFYVPIFTPTSAGAGNYSALSFTGNFVPNGVEHAAFLNNPAATAVNLDSNVTLGYLRIDSAGGYTIGGSGQLNLDGGDGAAALFSNAGSHAINQLTNVVSDTRANIAQDASVTFGAFFQIGAGKRLTKVGAGTLAIGSTQAHGAGASIAADAGTLNVATNIGNGIAVAADRPDLFASNGTTVALVNLNASQQLDSVAANANGTIRLAPGGNKVITTNTVSAAGKIDLGDGDLIVKTTPIGTWNGTAYTDVSGLVDTGRGAAGNALWDGNGIVTTDTRAINSNDLTSIGVASASDIRAVTGTQTATWNGQTVAATDTLAMFTWGGDANLDGKVNIDDYGQIDSNVSKSGTVFGWNKGDFNYDGKINIDDYGIIDGNINRQGSSLATPASALDGVAAVPEPASAAILGLGAAAALTARRRRRGR